MPRKISSEFQWMLHISFLGKILKDNPSDYIQSVKEIGTEVGRRLVDDFCSRHSLFTKLPNDEIVQYMKIFLELYFEKDVQINEDGIIFTNEILRRQGRPGTELFREILHTVFHLLNNEVVLEVAGDDKIHITFNHSQ